MSCLVLTIFAPNIRSASGRYARRTLGPLFYSARADNRHQSAEYHGESFGARATVARGVAIDGLNVVSSRSSISRLPFVSNSHPRLSNSNSFNGSPPPSVDSVVPRNHVGATFAVDRTNSFGSLRHRGLARTVMPVSEVSRTDFRFSHPMESTVEQRLLWNFESRGNNWGSRPKVNGAVDLFQARFILIIAWNIMFKEKS